MRFTLLFTLTLFTACDDGTGNPGEPDRSGYTPEDYVPEGIDMALYDTEAKRVCLLYNAVARTRYQDCDPETNMSLSALTTCASRTETGGEWSWQAGCLEHMATARCAELEGPEAGAGNDGCFLVESWEEWRNRS